MAGSLAGDRRTPDLRDTTGSPGPDAVVAVYADEADLTTAIKHLEAAGFDMAGIFVLGKGMSEERHVVGFETRSTHTARWARWGGLWGGSLTGLGIPAGGPPVYVADLRAERFLVIAHGTTGEVDRARELLGQTAHERIDRHRATPSAIEVPPARVADADAIGDVALDVAESGLL